MNSPTPVWAHRQSTTAADRRGSPRFKPLNVIPAAFGGQGWRFVGQIVDISTTGVSIQRYSSDHIELVHDNETVDVDFVLGDEVFMATAKVIRIFEDVASLQFDQVLTKHAVQVIIERGRGSAIRWEPGRAIVHGELGIRVLNEIMQATAAGRVIDLRHVSQIDSAGIGVALLALDQRGALDSCHEDIRDLLSASGVCFRCAGACSLSGKRK